MKFTFIGSRALKEYSFKTVTESTFGEILNWDKEISTFSFMFEFEGRAILDLTYIVKRPNGEIHFSPSNSDRSRILIALFDKDDKVYFPDSWEQVMSWGL